jgi:Holliday junction resolvase RusA-like endonuclease
LGFKLTKQTKAYYEAVAIFASGETVAPETDAERRTAKYRVEMHVYYPPKKRGDIDNHAKAGIDALVRCGVIHSDHNVVELMAIPHRDDRENPRTEYTIERL